MITRRWKNKLQQVYLLLTSPLVRLVAVLSCLQSLCRTDKAPDVVQEGQSKVLCDHSTGGNRGGSKTRRVLSFTEWALFFILAF